MLDRHLASILALALGLSGVGCSHGDGGGSQPLLAGSGLDIFLGIPE